MISYSNVSLVGRLTDDAKIFGGNDGRKVVRFTVAQNEYYTNAAGETVQDTTWIPCVGFGTERFADMMRRRVCK